MAGAAKERRVLIIGAAGRDFHINVAFRVAPSCEVVAFTSAQIPGTSSDGATDRRSRAAAWPMVLAMLPTDREEAPP